MATSRALLVGQSYDLMMAVPPLLSRAGLIVDVISTSRLLVKTKDIANIHYVDHLDKLIEAILTIYSNEHGLVIIGDDELLQIILAADIQEATKLALLPVASASNFGHLHSKIGLSQILSDHGVITPDYRVAHNAQELLELSDTLGYPVMVKVDASGGGLGVFECNASNDVMQLCNRSKDFPLLIQKKIIGDLLDLSGFYQKGQLIHFSYSKVEATVGHEFGPSSLRTYTQLASVDKKVFDQLRSLGHALGINGFANVTAILSNETREIYFIEADLRPNVWVDYSKYIGDDPALAIKHYFKSGEAITYPIEFKKKYPETLLIPHFRRMRLSAFIFNKHKVWNFTHGFKAKHIASYFLLQRINPYELLVIRFIKPHIPAPIWKRTALSYKKAKAAIASLVH